MKTKINHLLPNGKFISSLGVIGEQNEELFRGVEKNGRREEYEEFVINMADLLLTRSIQEPRLSSRRT